jgi:protein TonB
MQHARLSSATAGHQARARLGRGVAIALAAHGLCLGGALFKMASPPADPPPEMVLEWQAIAPVAADQLAQADTTPDALASETTEPSATAALDLSPIPFDPQVAAEMAETVPTLPSSPMTPDPLIPAAADVVPVPPDPVMPAMTGAALKPADPSTPATPAPRPKPAANVPPTKPAPAARPPSTRQAQSAPGPVTAQAAAPSPPAPLAEPSVDQLAGYQRLLGSHLDRYRFYPLISRQRREEGVVLVRFTIDKTGRVLSATLQKTSGFAYLDREAIDMLHRAEPLPVSPTVMRDGQIELIFPLRFRLG